MASVKRILVIEDNANLALGLRTNLAVEGYAVEAAADGLRGLERARQGDPDLIILDLMLPGMDGYRVLETIRTEGYDAPVLILTARQGQVDKVRGFRLGADDYVTKPFGLEELLARVEALLRRASAPRRREAVDEPDVITFGDITILPKCHQVQRAGRNVELRPKELELLFALARRRGETLSRLALLREVWGYRDNVHSRTVDTHMAELRRKLEVDPSSPRYLISVRKVGYQLRA